MYIEDRIYSECSDEVYYSVTLTEDELRLYSEFQEYLFSDKSEKKLGWMDRENLKAVKRLKKNEGTWKEGIGVGNTYKGYKAHINDDYETAEKESNKLLKKYYKVVTPVSGVLGAAGGAMLGGKKHRLLGAAIGAASGVATSGAGYLAGKAGNKLGHKLAKKTDKLISPKTIQQRKDEIKVAEGKMSEAEFINKYGK